MVKLIVQEDFRTMTVRMYLEVQRGNQTVIIGQKDGKLIEQVLDTMTPSAEIEIVPLLEMDSYFAKDFIQSVSQYASGIGVKNDNENLLQGKLAATEKHLEIYARILQKFWLK